MRYLEIFDANLERIDVLDTASKVSETDPLNGVPSFSFTIPMHDDRGNHIRKRGFVRYDHGQIFRVLTTDDLKNSTSEKKITCEGAIATLADDLMFQDHIIDSGNNTSDAIRYIMNHQTIQRWVLGECDFEYWYEYGLSSENLLNALMSIPKPFTSGYRFVYDTSVYPWRLSLKRISEQPTYYVFEKLNFLQEKKVEESTNLYTRLYGLGAGEGVNQVVISDINNGLPYVDAPQEYIDKYGLISGVYTAREYDNAETLKAAMDAMILQVCEPQVTYSIDAVDLHELMTGSFQNAEPGDSIRLSDGTITYITQIQKNYDQAGDMKLTVSNKPTDLANSLAEIADRQRIEMTYSQGATQLWSNTTSDNANSTNGHTHPIWMPRTARIVNSVNVKIELERFRAYSKTTTSGGASTVTSSSGGESTQTSESGGGTTETSSPAGNATYTSSSGGGVEVTSESGGGTSDSSTGNGVFGNASYSTQGPDTDKTGKTATGWDSLDNHQHSLSNHKHTVPIQQHTHKFSVSSHSHKVKISSHRHSIDVGNHTHTVEIPSHNHMIRIPSHTHKVDTPNHRHDIEYGIFNSNETPSRADVYINGEFAFSMGTSYEGDITQYLIGSSGKIPRGTFIKLQVKPDTLAKVTVSSATQAFIQSKTGGNY
ncbi:MAG: phage tail protein [Anaerolineaceae bacterium]|nr:phage tail protein [Anaerolineaceae bacterium]